MKKFLLVSLAIFGGLAVLFVVGAVGIGVLAASSKPAVPGNVVLELEINEPFAEITQANPLEAFSEVRQLTLRDVVDALEQAGDDKRVKGVIVYVGTSPGSAAAVQELRDAVKAFRAKGKKAVAFADTFGEFTGGNGAYYLASAFDEVYLQPSGDVGLIGFAAESPFARAALEKMGIKPQMNARHEYKNAVNMFTEESFTGPHREATEKLITSMFDQMVKDVAADRGIDEAALREMIDQGPHLGGEAVEAKLVDGLAYRDEVYANVQEGWGKDAKLLWLDRYLKRAGRPNERGTNTIALIYGVGQVMRGDSNFSPLSGEATMGGDSVAAAFRRAVKDDDVKAIIFRVDSPGGSYVASDTIRREVQKARDAGKPVIVTMGNLAASGGYFVAMDADRIIAQPGTITGSIGVYAGKFVTAGLWEKLGVNWETVSVGKNSTLFSTDAEFTPEQLAKINAELDRIYEDFTTKAAAGRKLPLEKLQEVAKGRVWTGADAKELGLVDELGGYATALRAAKELAKLPADADVRVQVFPKPKTPIEELLAAMGGQDEGENSESEGATARASLKSELRDLREVYGVLEALGVRRNAGVLTAPVPQTTF